MNYDSNNGLNNTVLVDEYASKIRVIVSEIDRVLTEGLGQVDTLGIVVSKNYFLCDLEAINKLKKNFKFVFMSSNNDVNWAFCNKRQIPFFHAQKNKLKTLSEIANRYNVNFDNILYVGSMLSDLQCVKTIPFSFSTFDAPSVVKNSAFAELNSYGGTGVINEILEILSFEIIRREKDK